VTIFATSGCYAIFDRDDDNDIRAKAALAQWVRDGVILVTTNYVLLETAALLQQRIGIAAVGVLYEEVTPLLQVDWVDEVRHHAGMEAMLAAGRRKLGLVDCLSFQTMRTKGVRIAFSFDAHFRERGFATKPAWRSVNAEAKKWS
jgi:predicted nucleic acid-binding protein